MVQHQKVNTIYNNVFGVLEVFAFSISSFRDYSAFTISGFRDVGIKFRVFPFPVPRELSNFLDLEISNLATCRPVLFGKDFLLLKDNFNTHMEVSLTNCRAVSHARHQYNHGVKREAYRDH